MLSSQLIKKSAQLPTPFYYYDMELLDRTLKAMKSESVKHGFNVHYAVKANFNTRIMETIAGYGFGADCVSGNEIEHAIATGFDHSDIVFAGVGKSDREIEYALQKEILCFNCESAAELEVVAQIAGRMGKVASIALRINPNVDANTHEFITTGVEDTKFGIHIRELENVVELVKADPNLRLRGIHFHIGSQILDMEVFRNLCLRVNEIQEWFDSRKIDYDIINVGGGLGIDHYNPEKIPSFKEYFEVFGTMLRRKDHQRVFFEIGRAAVGQSGNLISRVLYIKDGKPSKYAIIDAGMNDLVRPSLYKAFHLIENLTSTGSTASYTIAGPVCESSDIFAKNIELPATVRGDIMAIRSAGAYGEAMASRYNMRDLIRAEYSDRM